METLSRISGALGWSTAIVFAMAMLSLWVCWLERKEKTNIWKIGCLMAFLGVLTIIFSIKEELASQDAAAEARLALKEMEEKQGQRFISLMTVPETLQAMFKREKERKLAEDPNSIPWMDFVVDVEILSAADDESAMTAGQLKNHFDRAADLGFNVIAFERSTKEFPIGITILKAEGAVRDGDKGPEAATLLFRALRERGLETTLKGARNFRLNTIVILVGPNPRLLPQGFDWVDAEGRRRYVGVEPAPWPEGNKE